MYPVFRVRDTVDKTPKTELLDSDQIVKFFQGLDFTVFTAFDKLAQKHFFSGAGRLQAQGQGIGGFPFAVTRHNQDFSSHIFPLFAVRMVIAISSTYKALTGVRP